MKAKGSLGTSSHGAQQRAKSRSSKTPARLISLLLAIVLVVTMVPALAFATSTEEPVVENAAQSTGEIDGTDARGANTSGTEQQGSAVADTEDAVGTADTQQSLTLTSDGSGMEETDAGFGELVLASTPERIADEVLFDKATAPYEIAVTDADAILQVKIDDVMLLPENLTDVIEEEDIEWSVKDNDKLVLADDVVAGLTIGAHELKLVFAEGEETAELKIKDSVAEVEAAAALGAGLIPQAVTKGNNKLILRVGDDINGFVDVDEVGNATTWPTSTTNKQLQIYAEFDPAATNRTILITVPTGYQITEYSAKSTTPDITGVRRLGLSPADDDKVRSAELTGVADGIAWDNQSVSNYTKKNSSTNTDFRTYGGKILYTFNSNCNRITLTITLNLQTEVLPHASTSYVMPDITAAMSSTHELDTYLRATVTGLNFQTTAGAGTANGGSRTIEGDPSTGLVDVFRTGYRATALTDEQNHYVDSMTFSVTYPKGATYQGFSEVYLRVAAQNDPNGGWYGNNHLKVTNDPANHKVTFEYTNFYWYRTTTSGFLHIYWTMDMTEYLGGNWNGDTVKLTFPATLDVKSGNILNSQAVHPQSTGSVIITVKAPDWNITLKPLGKIRADLSEDRENPFPYDYLLGAFTVANSGPSIATDLKYTWEFDDALAVRSVCFPGNKDSTSASTVSNVVIWTKNAQGQADTRSISGSFLANSAALNHGIMINSKALGLAEGEYITKLTADQDNLNAFTYGNTYTFSNTSYYGRFQNESTGSATLTIEGPGNFKVTATDTPNIGWTQAGSGEVSTTAVKVVASGEDATGSWHPNDQLNFTSVYRTSDGNVRQSNEVIDPIISIALPEGIVLDPSSILATSVAGNHEGQSFSLGAPVSTDEKEVNGIVWKIYRYTSPVEYDMIARATNDRTMATNEDRIILNFTANVSSACKAYAAILPQNVVMWDLGQTAINAKNSPSYDLVDTNSFAGKGETYVVAADRYGDEFAVVQKKGLMVNLGIRTVDSGTDFYTYDGTAATVAPVTPADNAEIQLTYANTSDNIFYKKTEIYLPIPKSNKEYESIFNNASSDPQNVDDHRTPQFSMYLTGPVTMDGFTTWYTTDDTGKINGGVVDKTWEPVSYTWEAADTVNFEEVTMIKFVADDPIAAAGDLSGNDVGGVTFELKVDDTAALGQQNFWRSYQKGWEDATGTGSWHYGSVLAAEPSKAGVIGQLFVDENANGIMEAGDEYDNSSINSVRNITAVLTEKDNKIAPLALKMEDDGSFRSLSATGAPYLLKEGEYTVTISNGDSLMSFSPKTSTATRSDGKNWYMDIAQANIASNQKTATFIFVVDTSAGSLSTEYIGVGLTTKPVITYIPGAGTSFAQYDHSVVYNSTASGAPTLDATNTLPGYTRSSESWILDKDVTLSGGTAITKGTPLTRAQLYQVKVTENIEATVSLSLSLYNITYAYDDNGGVNPEPANTPSLSDYGSKGVAYTTPNQKRADSPTMEGYTFSGWDTGDVVVEADGSFSMPHNDVAFTGYWIINTHDIEYKYVDNPVTGLSAPAGVDPVPVTVSGVAYATPDIAVEAAPSLTGYAFHGWTATAESKVTVSSGSYTMPDNKVIFTGYWSVNTYPITYSYVKNAAGDNIPVNAPSTAGFGKTNAEYNSAQNVAANPSLQGYTFSGWTPVSGIGAQDLNGTAFTMPAGAVSFEGSWEPNSYTLSYNGNTNTGGTAPAQQSVIYGKNFNVAGAGDLVKQGYVFKGWNTEANGSGMSYSAGEMPLYNTVGNTTLYAQWDAANGIAYSVEHYLVDASGNASLDFTEQRTGTTNATVYAGQRSYAPTHSYNANYPGTVASGQVLADGTLTLKLYYTLNTYTVTFVDYNGATLASRTGVPYGGDALAPANPFRTGYTFTGWDRGFTNITADIVVTALYTPLTFTVTFVDGQGTTLQSSTVVYGGGVTPPANPTRTGYTFAGWDLSSAAWTNVTSNALITAQWTPVEAPVTTPTTSTVTPGTSETTTTTTTPITTDTPGITIPGTDIPLFGQLGNWSLFDLLCAIAGLMVFALALALGLMRKKRVDEATGQSRNYRRIEGMWVSTEGDIIDESKEGKRHMRKVPLIISGVLAIAMVILFIITQDMTLNMALFDSWSIVFGIGLIVGILAAIFTFRRVKVADEEEPELQAL